MRVSHLKNLPLLWENYHVDTDYVTQIRNYRDEWEEEVDRLYHLGHSPLPSQSEVIGVVNEFSRPEDVMVCAAGSLPGDLHKVMANP